MTGPRKSRPAAHVYGVEVGDIGSPVSEVLSKRWPYHKTGQGVRCRWSGVTYIGPECPCPDGCETS